jgi:inner membrane transporter RhtA
MRRFPASGYFVGSAVFHYLGPAFAVLLFTRVEPLGVAWLRIVSAAAILGAWRRPWRAIARCDRKTRRLIALMGLVLAAMNAAFYTAIDHLPLGTVAAVEFLPVIGLAAIGMRTLRNAAALVLAAAGVVAVTHVQVEGTPVGLGLAFVNAALFACYIVAAHRVAQSPGVAGIDGLAGAMVAAAVVVMPAAPAAGAALTDPALLGAGIGIGVTSSVIPYVCDQLAMARLPRPTYALLVSLLPATATVVGLLVLGQVPTAAEVAGVALVVAGVALHREPQRGSENDDNRGDGRQEDASRRGPRPRDRSCRCDPAPPDRRHPEHERGAHARARQDRPERAPDRAVSRQPEDGRIAGDRAARDGHGDGRDHP